MAQKVTVSLEDDLDGSPASETMRFGLFGTEYEIDLNERNADTLREQLAPFIQYARRADRAKAAPVVRSAAHRERTAGIRAWARDQGMTVSERGRIPANVIQQYEAAAGGRSSR